jgi:hypothetical protein
MQRLRSDDVSHKVLSASTSRYTLFAEMCRDVRSVALSGHPGGGTHMSWSASQISGDVHSMPIQ